MCGRYVTISKLKEIEKRFNISTPEPGNYKPSANIAPGQYAPVITNEKAWLSGDASLNEITAMLKPFEATDMNAYPVSPKIKNPKENEMELLKPTGQRIFKEYDYELYDEITLEGMGNTRARQRKNNQGKQGELF